MNAVLYLRCSDSRQENSVADQRVALARHAKSRKYTIVREYVDDGISGDATEKRAAFLRMIADAPRGEFSVILSWDQDRFGRFDSVEAGYYLYPLRKSGISLETIAQGVIDWTDLAGRLVYTVQQEAKHSYLRDLSRNVARGMVAGAAAGRWQGGKPPFGYRVENRSLAIDEPNATHVREMFQKYLEGSSSRRLAAWLDAKGVRAPNGGAWTNMSVLQVLRNELYTGVMVWNRNSRSKYSRIANGSATRIEGTHPAIVDAFTFSRVAEVLLIMRARTTTEHAKGIYALSGLLFCGLCGSVMHGRRDRHGKPAYGCSSYVLHRKCLPNWTAQADILERLKEKLTISAKTLADMAEEIETTLKRRKVSHAAVVKISTLTTRLAKAKARLLEVDRDMVPIVQQQIRDIQADLNRRKSTPVDEPSDVGAKVASGLADIPRLIECANAEDLNRQLAALLKSIIVTVNPVQCGQHRRFEFVRAVATTHAGIPLTLE